MQAVQRSIADTLSLAQGKMIRVDDSREDFFEFKGLQHLTNAYLRVQQTREDAIGRLPITTAVFKWKRIILYSHFEDYAVVFNCNVEAIKEHCKGESNPRVPIGAYLLRRVTYICGIYKRSISECKHFMRYWRDWECSYYLTIKYIITQQASWKVSFEQNKDLQLRIKKNREGGSPYTIILPHGKAIYIRLPQWITNRHVLREKKVLAGIEMLNSKRVVRLKPNLQHHDHESKWEIEHAVQKAIKAAALRNEDMRGLSVPLDIMDKEIFLPYYTNDLWNLISAENMQKPQQLLFMFLITKGVSKLHELGYTHHDLKLENIMLDHQGLPVIIDFAFAQKLTEVTDFNRGTAGYVPPYSNCNPEEWDAWTLGLILLMVMNKKATPMITGPTAAYRDLEVNRYHSEPMPPKNSLRWVVRMLLAEHPSTQMTPREALPIIEEHYKRGDVSEMA